MFAPRLFIYEKRPRWGPELKRQFLGSDIPVRSVRTLSEAGELIAAGPPGLLVMDLRAGAGECLRFTSRSRERGWPVRTLFIGSAGTRDLEWVARELGADHFVEETIGGGHLARLCRRYLKQLTTGDVVAAETPA